MARFGLPGSVRFALKIRLFAGQGPDAGGRCEALGARHLLVEPRGRSVCSAKINVDQLLSTLAVGVGVAGWCDSAREILLTTRKSQVASKRREESAPEISIGQLKIATVSPRRTMTRT